MRDLSTAHKTALAEEVTYQGWLLAIVPSGLSPVYLNTIGADYTDGNSPVITYLGDPGFVMGSIRITDGTDPGALDVDIPVSDDGPVTPDNVTRGLYNGAMVVLRVVDYVNGEVSPPIGFIWSVGQTSITNDGKAKFEMRAATRINRELLLKTIGPGCSVNWADMRCGVDPTAYTDTVEVVSVVSDYEFTVSGSLRADGFFQDGAIKFISGDNISQAYTVRSWELSTATVKLWEPLRADLAAGDDATIHAGCDKSTGDGGCAKFSNIARYQGFDALPGDDVKFQYTEPEPVTETTTETKRYNWSTGQYE